MSNKTPLPKHVIRAMRRDDGFIRAEIIGTQVEYVVNLRTVDGYMQHCTVSRAVYERLVDEGIIKHVGLGKYKLTDVEGKEE